MAPRPGSTPPLLVPLAGGAPARLPATGGRVWLVGAGPGDPELLTVKASRVLARADILLHDRLVGPEILNLAPARARRIYVGKRKSEHSVPQEEVNALLVALARSGLEVVRLKGGDPFVFGRGGEELLACREAGVPCEIVPGVTAAVAAAASAGAPLTHRGLAASVVFVTGHSAGEDASEAPETDWGALSRPGRTLVVYMGATRAEAIARRLMALGRAPSTPVLAVENASLPQERRVLTDLENLHAALRGLAGPVVLVVGEVAGLADAPARPLPAPGAAEDGAARLRSGGRS